LVESFPLEEEDVVLRKCFKESEILSKGSGIEADGGPYPFGFQIRDILKHTVPAGGYRKTLNQE
jgi:hypothetical protein